MKKVKISQIPHNPAIGGTFDIYWKCSGDDAADWILAGNVTVDAAGILQNDLFIEFDSSICTLGIAVQAVSSCNGVMTGKLFSITTTTTTTSTTTTTTVACPSIVQVFGTGYSGTP